MLVLSRTAGSKTNIYYIDENGDHKKVTFEVLQITGNRVRIGFDAQNEVTILRDEIDGTGPDNIPVDLRFGPNDEKTAY